MYLYYIKFVIEKGDSHTQVVPNVPPDCERENSLDQ